MKKLFSIILPTFLIACGGGGGGGGAGTSTPPVQQTAEGIWNGTATPGGAVKMLVQPNGAFYQFYGTASPNGGMFGVLSVDANNTLTFSSSFGLIGGLYEQNKNVYNSSVVTNATLNYTVSGGVGDTRVITQTYDSSYTSPFTLANLVGNYSGAPLGQASTFAIDANGNITGNAARRIVSGSCPITGTITPNANKRFAVVSITGCTDSVNGVGVALLEGNGVGQKVYIGTQSGYGYTLYGVKQ